MGIKYNDFSKYSDWVVNITTGKTQNNSPSNLIGNTDWRQLKRAFHKLMADSNKIHLRWKESGNHQTLEKLIDEHGMKPEAAAKEADYRPFACFTGKTDYLCLLAFL